LRYLQINGKGGDTTMSTALEEQPFKNIEDVKAEIKRCSTFASICMYVVLLFVIIGVASEAAGSGSFLWFMLAIVSGLVSLHPQLHNVTAKSLLFSVEAQSKKE
jgi:hypothetical protein